MKVKVCGCGRKDCTRVIDLETEDEGKFELGSDLHAVSKDCIRNLSRDQRKNPIKKRGKYTIFSWKKTELIEE